MKILVSACLLGQNCKYSGGNNYNKDVVALGEKFELVPICPEVFGGLDTPRSPSEIIGDRVMNKDGEDVTEQFKCGAEQALYIANENNCGVAVLKERSPSCGCGKIYDGSFTSTVIDGNGIATQLFLNNGIEIYGESKINKLLDTYGE